jgi:hypothetical protein
MPISINGRTYEKRRIASVETDSCDAIRPLFESLLEHSVGLRDLYLCARRRTWDSRLLQLRLLFDRHYKEQVRLTDVLVDQARVSGGAGRIFAGVFIQDSRLCGDIRNSHARLRMLRSLLDAHEGILSDALSGGDENPNPAWFRDLTIGQVVLANAQQRQSICDLLGNRAEDSGISIAFQSTAD